jgi:histidinol-phosphatase
MAAPSSDRWIAFLREIADRADAIALRHFRSPDLATERKADRSPVSIADKAIEEAARDLTRRRHPGLGFHGEEFGDEVGSGEARLICDPIDATENFIRGIPIFATLLAIEEAGEITAGLVSAPSLALRWSAARGCGAFCGDRRLRVSQVGRIEDGQVFHADLRYEGGRTQPPGLEALLTPARRTRGFGDFYQHLLVAEGAGEVAVDAIARAWDIAPLLIIVEQAGGRATTLGGERTIYGGSLVTSNGLVHARALDLLRA